MPAPSTGKMISFYNQGITGPVQPAADNGGAGDIDPRIKPSTTGTTALRKPESSVKRMSVGEMS
jgi:hypothetical protein